MHTLYGLVFPRFFRRSISDAVVIFDCDNINFSFFSQYHVAIRGILRRRAHHERRTHVDGATDPLHPPWHSRWADTDLLEGDPTTAHF